MASQVNVAVRDTVTVWSVGGIVIFGVANDGPGGPCIPFSPLSPLAPLRPLGPIGPVRPVSPLLPFSPLGPALPRCPLLPDGPLGPDGPFAFTGIITLPFSMRSNTVVNLHSFVSWTVDRLSLLLSKSEMKTGQVSESQR